MAMERCRFYVVPSHREGMPRWVLEAMAIGRPVISSTTPGRRDGIEDGRTDLVILVPAEAWAQAMRGLIDNPHLVEFMGQGGHRPAVDRLDGRRVGEQVAQLLCAGAGA
jgi:glycosyltransferase involved in cell wall biosynthesis